MRLKTGFLMRSIAGYLHETPDSYLELENGQREVTITELELLAKLYHVHEIDILEGTADPVVWTETVEKEAELIPFFTIVDNYVKMAKLLEQAREQKPNRNRTEYKVVIAGSRDFNDYPLLKKSCDTILTGKIITHKIIVISGGARGADLLGERYARERGYEIRRFIPDWNKDGRSAGIIRNRKMIDIADGLIAFWDGISRGTRHSIETATRKGIVVNTIYFSNK